MRLDSLHFLLTYQCTYECEHCFVWGSPWQAGVFTLAGIEAVLDQARELGTVGSVYFEGGEPFLYYPILLAAAQAAGERGFRVGVVTNAFWATDLPDALAWLAPLATWVDELSVSSDLFHAPDGASRQVRHALQAATQLGLEPGVLSIEHPSTGTDNVSRGQLAEGTSGVMYRGRAAEVLAPHAPQHSWEDFCTCPHEDLEEPGRLHLDPQGNLHICQGILLGNLFDEPLASLLAAYDPARHPVIGPLLEGGPAGLVREYSIDHDPQYADACHLCYRARQALRPSYPRVLAPDAVYGQFA